MKTGAIELVWIVVADLPKAIEYYTKILGMKLLEHVPEYGWAELQSVSQGARLGIAQADSSQGMHAGKNAVVTITVDDMDQARNHLIKKGATILGGIQEVPGHVKLQMLADPDGNHLQIVQKLS